MNSVFNIVVHYSGGGNHVIYGDSKTEYNISAKDDIFARERAIEMLLNELNEKVIISFCEIKRICVLDN